MDRGTKDHSRQCWIIDSFAFPGKQGTGNPAAVVLLASETNPNDADTQQWMKSVAIEFNLSETAFIWPCDRNDTHIQERNDDDKLFHIRYYTCNGSEVDLCGHATLASASVVLHILGFGPGKKGVDAIFHAKHDILRTKVAPPISKISDSGCSAARIAMDFPWKDEHEITEVAKRSDVISMIKSAFHLRSDAGVLYVGIDCDEGDILVEVTQTLFLSLCDEEKVDFSHMVDLDGYNRGIIVCCKCTSKEEDNNTKGGEKTKTDFDFISRFFGPKVGINEDPVTGSAHCVLGPYFGTKLGKLKLLGKQMSSRGGVVECTLKIDESTKRVGIVGTAVTFMSGTLHI
mmetsp:Transcript_26473/g.38686  ORF Transcript_26473/g.38686 Transcript_26473/m.38686 type:complete len:344 (+) Transcript_26473:80-1111(+)